MQPQIPLALPLYQAPPCRPHLMSASHAHTSPLAPPLCQASPHPPRLIPTPRCKASPHSHTPAAPHLSPYLSCIRHSLAPLHMHKATPAGYHPAPDSPPMRVCRASHPLPSNTSSSSCRHIVCPNPKRRSKHDAPKAPTHYLCQHSLVHALTLAHMHSLVHALTLARQQSLVHALTLACQHSLVHALTLAHMHTHRHTHKHAHARAYTHTQAQTVFVKHTQLCTHTYNTNTCTPCAHLRGRLGGSGS